LSRAFTDFGSVDKNVDGRDKPGHDGGGSRSRHLLSAIAFTFILAIIGFVGWVYSLGPLPLD
jgi:penicillin-binding protein 1C